MTVEAGVESTTTGSQVNASERVSGMEISR